MTMAAWSMCFPHYSSMESVSFARSTWGGPTRKNRRGVPILAVLSASASPRQARATRHSAVSSKRGDTSELVLHKSHRSHHSMSGSPLGSGATTSTAALAQRGSACCSTRRRSGAPHDALADGTLPAHADAGSIYGAQYTGSVEGPVMEDAATSSSWQICCTASSQGC